MEHRLIAEELWIERYVAGRLSPREEARFEDHYLDCQPCLEAVKANEALVRGLRQVAAEESLGLAIAASAVRRQWLRRSLPWAALLACAIAASLFLLPGLRTPTPAPGPRVTEQAQINTAILSLSPLRGEIAAGAQNTAHRLTLANKPEWVVLSLSLDGLDQESALPEGYSLHLKRAGKSLWQDKGLLPDHRGELVLSLHSSLLTPGDYLLEVLSGQEGAERVLSRYPLHIRLARAG